MDQEQIWKEKTKENSEEHVEDNLGDIHLEPEDRRIRDIFKIKSKYQLKSEIIGLAMFVSYFIEEYSYKSTEAREEIKSWSQNIPGEEKEETRKSLGFSEKIKEAKRLSRLLKEVAISGNLSLIQQEDREKIRDYYRKYIGLMRRYYPESRQIEIAEEKEKEIEYPDEEKILRGKIIGFLERINKLIEYCAEDKDLKVFDINDERFLKFFRETGTNEDYETICNTDEKTERDINLQLEIIEEKLRRAEDDHQKNQKMQNEIENLREKAKELDERIEETITIKKNLADQGIVQRTLKRKTIKDHERRIELLRNIKERNNLSILDYQGSISDIKKDIIKKLDSLKGEINNLFNLLEIARNSPCKIIKDLDDKYELLKFSSQEEFKYNFDYLMAVHCSYFEPLVKNGQMIIQTTSSVTQTPFLRNTIHFTINHVVLSHMFGNWENVPIVYCFPFRGMVEKNGIPNVYNTEDTYWLGDIKIPEGSIMFIKKGHYKLNFGSELFKFFKKVIVCEDPYSSAREYIEKSKLIKAPDIVPGMPDSSEEINNLPFRSKYEHFENSYLKTLDDLSRAIFSILSKEKREKSDYDRFEIVEALDKLLEVLEFLYEDKTNSVIRKRILRSGLDEESIKNNYIKKLPINKFIRIVLDEYENILFLSFYDVDKKNNDYYEKLVKKLNIKKGLISKLEKLRHLIIKNYSDLSKYSKIDKKNIIDLSSLLEYIRGISNF